MTSTVRGAVGGLSSRDIADVVANNVRRIRAERQVSLSELARRSNVAKATLSSLESASGNPTIETLSAIASALGCPLADLITDLLPQVAYSAEAQWVQGDELRGRLVTRLAGAAGVDVHEVVIQSGGRLADRPLPGSIEHLFVTEGSLEIATPGTTIALGPGDGMRLPAGVGYEVVAGPLSARMLFLVSSG